MPAKKEADIKMKNKVSDYLKGKLPFKRGANLQNLRKQNLKEESKY